jgi:hypothetical protein
MRSAIPQTKKPAEIKTCLVSCHSCALRVHIRAWSCACLSEDSWSHNPGLFSSNSRITQLAFPTFRRDSDGSTLFSEVLRPASTIHSRNQVCFPSNSRLLCQCIPGFRYSEDIPGSPSYNMIDIGSYIQLYLLSRWIPLAKGEMVCITHSVAANPRFFDLSVVVYWMFDVSHNSRENIWGIQNLLWIAHFRSARHTNFSGQDAAYRSNLMHLSSFYALPLSVLMIAVSQSHASV